MFVVAGSILNLNCCFYSVAIYVELRTEFFILENIIINRALNINSFRSDITCICKVFTMNAVVTEGL